MLERSTDDLPCSLVMTVKWSKGNGYHLLETPLPSGGHHVEEEEEEEEEETRLMGHVLISKVLVGKTLCGYLESGLQGSILLDFIFFISSSPPLAGIYVVLVSPDLRGKGLGALLMTAAEDLLRKWVNLGQLFPLPLLVSHESDYFVCVSWTGCHSPWFICRQRRSRGSIFALATPSASARSSQRKPTSGPKPLQHPKKEKLSDAALFLVNIVYLV